MTSLKSTYQLFQCYYASYYGYVPNILNYFVVFVQILFYGICADFILCIDDTKFTIMNGSFSAVGECKN